MSGHNRVQLMGNIAEPELRHTKSGTAVLGIRMATTEVYFNKEREKQETTEWHNVVIWGKRAEALAKILSKGSQLFIEGSLRTRKWETNEGDTRYTTEVHAREIVLCGRRPGSSNADEDTPEAQRAQTPPGDSDRAGRDDDDIPF